MGDSGINEDGCLHKLRVHGVIVLCVRNFEALNDCTSALYYDI
jgi:hypothetical protein